MATAAVGGLARPAAAIQPLDLVERCARLNRQLDAVTVPFSDGSCAVWKPRIDLERDYFADYSLSRVAPDDSLVWESTFVPGSPESLAAAKQRFSQRKPTSWTPSTDLMRESFLINSFPYQFLRTPLKMAPGPGGEGLLCGEMLLGIWRIDGNGRLLWHHFPDEPLGLILMTGMDAGQKGHVVVGGTGVVSGKDVGVATVSAVDLDGAYRWTWHFDGAPWETYAADVLAFDDGAAVAMVTSVFSINYLERQGERPSGYPQWLAWIDPAGQLRSIESLTTEGWPAAVARLPDGLVLTAAELPDGPALLFRIHSIQGRELSRFTLDLPRALGIEPGLSLWHLLPYGTVDNESVKDALVMAVLLDCRSQVGSCPRRLSALVTLSSRGIHKIEFG